MNFCSIETRGKREKEGKGEEEEAGEERETGRRKGVEMKMLIKFSNNKTDSAVVWSHTQMLRIRDALAVNGL